MKDEFVCVYVFDMINVEPKIPSLSLFLS